VSSQDVPTMMPFLMTVDDSSGSESDVVKRLPPQSIGVRKMLALPSYKPVSGFKSSSVQ